MSAGVKQHINSPPFCRRQKLSSKSAKAVLCRTVSIKVFGAF